MTAPTWKMLYCRCTEALMGTLHLSSGQASSIAVKLTKSDLEALIAALRGKS